MAEVATPSAQHRQHSGRFAHLYQPPSSGRGQSTQGDYFNSAPRKRQRAQSRLTDQEEDDWQLPAHHTPGQDDEAGLLSTESLVQNDRYALKGGLDTPGLLASTEPEKADSIDATARSRVQDQHSTRSQAESDFAGPLARERNGHARLQRGQSHHKSSPSWTRFALNLPLSIAGKMFSFGGAVLQGFYAGGGQGYELEGNSNAPASLRRRRSSFTPGTPIPGAWNESPPSHSNVSAHDAKAVRPAPNKRRLTDRDTWVVIGTPDVDAATPPSPKRRISSNTPRLSRPSISRAGSRRSMLSASRRHSYITSTGSPGTQQPHSPSRQQNYHRQSSPLHNVSSTTETAASMSPETEKLRRRQVKQERAADRTMTSMSRQLEELIRQGQQALGTKFVVQDSGEPEDEGFVDEF